MNTENDFENMAKNETDSSFIVELWALVRTNKKYWMTPIVIVLLLMGTLVILSATAAAPFLYSFY